MIFSFGCIFLIISNSTILSTPPLTARTMVSVGEMHEESVGEKDCIQPYYGTQQKSNKKRPRQVEVFYNLQVSVMSTIQ